MKAAVALILTLGVLSAGLMVGANVIIHRQGDQVTVRAETVAGDPAAAEGLARGADDADTRPDDSLRAGFRSVFGSPALALLFWSCFFSFFGYGAFDPLESLYYRDVLRVDVEWMGWLSAAAGVGGVVGSMLLMRLPARRVNVRTLLAVLASEGAFALLYVGTPWVAVACAGQVLLGVAFGMLTPLLSTLVQTHAPLSTIGRVNAVMGFGNNVAGVAPLLCAPALAEVLGVQGTLVLASLLVLCMPLAIGIARRKEISLLADEESGHGVAVASDEGVS